jgi:asparagine synthetase B (glutamine-hydrolysing)
MAHSVELRVPFLDHILVQAVFDLPLSRRFDPRESKVLLRRMLRTIVPDAVLDAQKRGFTPPSSYIDRMVTRRVAHMHDSILAEMGWIDAAKLRTLASQHKVLPWLQKDHIRRLLGIPKFTTVLFRILAFESWYAMLSNVPKPAMDSDKWIVTSG